MNDTGLLERISLLRARADNATWQAFQAGLSEIIEDFRAKIEDPATEDDEVKKLRHQLQVLRGINDESCADNIISAWEGRVEELKAQANPKEEKPL